MAFLLCLFFKSLQFCQLLFHAMNFDFNLFDFNVTIRYLHQQIFLELFHLEVSVFQLSLGILDADYSFHEMF
jgi:hypothetical protein